MSKKELKIKELEALRHIRNSLVHQGRSPSVRDLMRDLGYKSPRSALIVMDALISKGWVKRKSDGGLQLRRDLEEQRDHARTIEVPLVGSVSCGSPLFAEENIEAYIPVSQSLARPGSSYFMLRAMGDSMDKAGIEDGDFLLVRQQSNAEEGEKVVALIDDDATVKEFHKEKDVVVLRPRSKNKIHKPIVVSNNFVVQGIVVATIPELH